MKFIFDMVLVCNQTLFYISSRSTMRQDSILYWINGISSFRLKDNSVHFYECSPFWVGISTMYIVKMFEIVFSFSV